MKPVYKTVSELITLRYNMDKANIPDGCRAVVLFEDSFEQRYVGAAMILGFRIIWVKTHHTFSCTQELGDKYEPF